MKKQIIIIIVIIISCLLGFYLLIFVGRKKSNNGFTRKFRKVDFNIPHVFELPDRTFDIVRKSVGGISLHNYSNQFLMYNINYDLKLLRTQSLNVPKGLDSSYVNVDIRETNIYLSNSKGVVIKERGKIKFYPIQSSYSDLAIGISNSTVVARSMGIDKQGRTMSLIKVSVHGDSKIIETYKFPKQADGFIGNDGYLRYDKEKARLFYIYCYLGEFLCLDTNLKVIYKAKTIDTVTKANIKFGLFKKKLEDGTKVNELTQTAPPEFINKDIAVDDQFVFVASKLKADNESFSSFSDNQPIDVYDMENGRYLYSFYIPKYKGFEFRILEVKENKLIVIFNKYLIVYEFNPN